MQDSKFKAGDVVICTEPNGCLKLGNLYTVKICQPLTEGNEALVTLVEDNVEYYVWRFKLHENTSDLISQVKKAETLLGKRVLSVNNKPFTVDGVRVVNKHCIPSWADSDLVDKQGFAVYLEDEDDYIEISDAKEVTNVLKLTDSYDAVIGDGVVTVGCQTIPIDTVREIVRLADSL